MTRNRPRSTSNALKPRPQQQQPTPSRSPAVSRNANHHVQPPIPSRTPNNASVHPPDVAMSPASRYKQNLKVLRRLDPTILSIFDQFSYVCLYHHDGTKWEKKGIEGSMFLFEREEEPLYGFFILNRMNKNDYVQCLSSTDEMEISGQYLMYRTQHPGGPGPHHWLSNQPATPEMIGLWSHSTGAREPMGDVMMRLYGFVKRGIQYPDQFRYGPGKKPPPSTTTPSQSDVTDDSEVETNTNPQNSHNPRVYNNQPHNGLNAVNAPTPANAGGGMSELDQLFAKLVSSSGSAPASVVTAVLPQVQPNQANTLMSMLASMNGANGHGQSQNQAFVAGPQVAIAPATAAEPPRGQALLSSIFASVSGGGGGLNGLLQQSQPAQTQSSYNGTQIQTQIHTNGYNPSTQSHPHPSSHPQVSAPTQSSATPELEILSPKPSTAGLPQILTTNVIHELLGMPSSRSASASSSSYDSTGGSVEGAGVSGISQGPHHHGHNNYHPNSHHAHARLGVGRRMGGYDADADVDVTTGDEGDVSAVLEDGDAAEDEDEDGEDERSESSSGQRYPVPERRGYVYSGAVSAGVGSRRTSNPMIRMASGTSLNGYHHHHPHNHTSHHQGPNQTQHQSPHQNHTLLRVNSQTRVGGDVTPRASAGRQLVELEVERELVAKIGGGNLVGGGSGQESSSYGGSQSQSQEQPQPQTQQMYMKPYQTVSRFSAPSTFPSSAPASLPASSSTSTTISTLESALSSPPIPPSSAPAPSSSTTLQASMSASTIIPSSSSTPSRVKGRFQSGSELWPLPLPLPVPASSPSPSPMRKGKGSGPNNKNNASLNREGAISETGQSSPSLSLGRTAGGAQGDQMTMTSPVTSSSVYPNANLTMVDYDDGVVELDFSETAVLSDLHAFEARGKSAGGGSSLRAKEKEKEKEKARKRGGLPDFGGQSQSQSQSVDLKDGVKVDKKAGSNPTTTAPQANVSTTTTATTTTTTTTKLPPSSVSAVAATTVMGTNTNPGSPSTNLSLGSSSGTGFGASPSGLRGPIPIVFMAAAQAKAREKEKEKAGEGVNGNSGLVYANGASVPHVAGLPTSVSATSTIATPKTPPRQQQQPPSTSTSATMTTTTSPSGIQRGIAHSASLSEVAKNVVLNELSRNPIMDRRGPNSVMERNEFVREVLTLIHTDKSFVERLYQGYLEMV